MKRACELFPGGLPSPDYEERRTQLRAIIGDKVKVLDDLLSGGTIDDDLSQLLLEFWNGNRPIVGVELSGVKSAQELLKTISEALSLPGSYGKSLDAFFEAITHSDDVPRRLVLHGWNNVAVAIPKDAEVLLRLWPEVNKEYPECACELELR